MENSINNRHEYFLKKVHPCLREIMYKLFTSCRISLRAIGLKEPINRLPLEDLMYAYAFSIQIPYATRVLLWDIIFNPDCLTSAPDFNFNDEPFEGFIELTNINNYVPDWVNWNLGKPESLELIIGGFVKLFTEHQVNELSKVGAFISEEYHLAVSHENYRSSDIELFVDVQGAHFLINLHVDISEMPEFIQMVDEEGILVNPKPDYALLAVYFHDIEGQSKSIQLNLSPKLDQLIGDAELLCIPPYENISLMDYVPKLTQLLQTNINKTVFNFQFRREFIACLLILKAKCILEYNAFDFFYFSFLCEVNQRYFIVNIEPGERFPNEPAKIEILPFHDMGLNIHVPEGISFQYENNFEMVPDKMAMSILGQLKNFIVEHFEFSVPMITQ